MASTSQKSTTPKATTTECKKHRVCSGQPTCVYVKPAPKKAPGKKAPTTMAKAPVVKITEAPSAKAKATPKASKDGVKTWTQTAIEVRAAVADIKARLGDDAKGLKFEIVTRKRPVYATTTRDALAAPISDEGQRYDVQKGTNVPEVRGDGYVCTLQGVTRGGEVKSTWLVWLSPAEGAVLLTQDGKRIKA